MGNIAVIGAGSWGTALAHLLAGNGHEVRLWSRNREVVEEINHERSNRRYLQDAPLHPGIQATHDLAWAAQEAEVLLLAVPSHAVRETVERLKPLIRTESTILHAVKGMEEHSLLRMSEVILQTLGGPQAAPGLAVLSGPSHAEEVVRGLPTTVVIASASMEVAERLQAMLMNAAFRVYVHHDVIGVEVAGALKNVIALAAGISDGMGYGDNAKAAIVTRGLAEISRLGVAMGALAETFSGLAGVGDLIVTCTSTHSRNWRAGYRLAQGQSLQQVTAEMGMVVEGIKSTRVAKALSQRHGVEMPITEQLYQVLFEGLKPQEAVNLLMNRMGRHEMETRY